MQHASQEDRDLHLEFGNSLQDDDRLEQAAISDLVTSVVEEELHHGQEP